MSLHDTPSAPPSTAAVRPSAPAAPPPDAGEPSTALRLREIATELFAERGYAGTSLSELASRLGIRKPSLYNHFRSKDELFLELFESSFEAWKMASRPIFDARMAESSRPDDGDERAPSSGPPAGAYAHRLYRNLCEAVGFAVESPHAVALCRVAVTQVTGDLEAKVQEVLARYRLEYQRALDAFFDDAKAAGEVIDMPSETLALAWLTFLDGVLTHFLFDTADRRQAYLEHLDELWHLFFRGLAKGGANPPAGEETAV